MFKIVGLLVTLLIIVLPIVLAAWVARWSVPNDGDYSGPPPRLASCLVSAPMKLVMLFIVPGALVGFLATSRILTTLDTRNWPTTEGTIYSTSIEEHSGFIKTYSIRVEYRFQVGEMPYSGFNVTWYDFRTLDRADLEPQVAKYPKGKVVTVHYDPDGPFNSVLETRFGPGIPFIIGLAISLLVVSMLATALYLRSLRLIQKHAHAALPASLREFY